MSAVWHHNVTGANVRFHTHIIITHIEPNFRRPLKKHVTKIGVANISCNSIMLPSGWVHVCWAEHFFPPITK